MKLSRAEKTVLGALLFSCLLLSFAAAALHLRPRPPVVIAYSHE